jgi:hypothetical protein
MAQNEFVWTKDVPIVTHPVVMRQLAMVFAISYFIICVLLGIAFWGTDSLEDLWPVAGMMLAICVGLFVVGVLGSLLIYGNRMTTRFRVDAKGVETEVIDARPRRVAKLTFWLGLLAGKPGAAGTGLLALSNMQRATRWQAIRRAKFHDGSRSIELKNAWRTILMLSCTAENYAAVGETVRARLAAQPQPARSGNPLLRGLGWSLAVVIASLPSFAMPWPFEVHLLAAMMLLCFAVATVWLVSPLAWAVLASIVWVLASIALTALEITKSYFSDRPPFPAYEIASGDDWAMLMLELAALAFLGWFAVSALRGKFMPVLMSDEAEMDGE